MKKDNSLKITIPNPCSQDWNAMPANNGGRYCGQCTQVVYDFSQMSDPELLQYFKSHAEAGCGRFHKHQLNRSIEVQKVRWSFPIYVRKMAAAFLAVLSFRTATAQVDKKTEKPATVRPVAKEKNEFRENIIITGRVTKGNAEPVTNAKVSIDTLITVHTDAEGRFSVPLGGNMITSHNLYFSYEGLVRTVRTFHPLMGSASYDVRLMSKDDDNYTRYVAGGISLSTIDFPSIRFSNRQHNLSSDAKAILSIVAEKLKDDPGVMIQLVAYGGSVIDTKNAKRKLKLIRNFLIKDLNIGNERIFDKIEEAGSSDTIDVLQYNGE